MKGLLGHDNLTWDYNKQEGVFAGQSVYDAATGKYNGSGPAPPPAQACFGGPVHSGDGGDGIVFGGAAAGPSPPQEPGEVEYPLPGSVASCDGCGEVVQRYYHCSDCAEATGLFDLCVRCCGAFYLKSGPALKIDHPTHDYETHRMVHVCPPCV